MMAASSGSGGGAVQGPAHSAPSSRAKRCALRIALPGEGEHPPALVPRDLRDEVRRRAEAVEAEARGVPAAASAR